jgi:regulator of sigma E protease
VVRNGENIELPIKEGFIENFNYDMDDAPFLSLLAPFTVREILPNTPAEKAGIRPGDRISRVNGNTIVTTYDMRRVINADDDRDVTLEIERSIGNKTEIIKTSAIVPEGDGLGILTTRAINFTVKTNSLPEAVVKGTARCFNTVTVQIKAFNTIITGEIAHQRKLSGPIGITSAFGTHQWRLFWTITASLCIVGAFINLLPLPRTVFWNIIPIGYEALSGKRYPYALFRFTRKVGVVILILLMLLVFVGDILRLI